MSPRPFLTPHALRRCKEMNVERAEVVEVIERHELQYPSPPGHGPGRLLAVGGRLLVVHTPDMVVITVMWAGAEGRYPDAA